MVAAKFYSSEHDRNSIRAGVILVSACLVGLKTRYDGREKKSAACLAALQDQLWVPVCPEQLGGLSTPRAAADLVGGDGEEVLQGAARVIDRMGLDVTANFIRGAEQVLKIATLLLAQKVYLRANSPSCGIGGKKGVTAALLMRRGIEVVEF